MKILDWYIVKKILATFFFVVAILITIITVIDITENIDKYQEHHLALSVVAHYYLTFIAWIAGLLIPITMFIAVVFVTSRLAAHTEIIAMLSGGMSFLRFLFPYAVAAFVVAAFSFTLNGWVIPKSNREFLDFKLRYLQNQRYVEQRNMHIQIEPNVYFYLQNYQGQSKTGYQFTLEKFKDNRLIEKVSAENIVWDSLKNKWNLQNWSIRKADTLFHQTTHVVAIDSAFVQKGLRLDTALSVTPDDFKWEEDDFYGMTNAALAEKIEKLKFRGSMNAPIYEVQLHVRYASAFTIFILTFMGAIVSSRKSRGGTGFQIALGFLLSFIFIIFFMIFSTKGNNGSISPFLAAWLPNIIFSFVTLGLFKYTPR